MPREAWRWSSLRRRERDDEKARSLLSDWPVDRPRDWLRRVNRAEKTVELDPLRLSVARGRPRKQGTDGSSK